MLRLAVDAPSGAARLSVFRKLFQISLDFRVEMHFSLLTHTLAGQLQLKHKTELSIGRPQTIKQIYCSYCVMCNCVAVVGSNKGGENWR